MALFDVNKVSLKGVAACVPKNIAKNAEYPYQTELERKQFIKTTGIEQRRIVDSNTTASDLCFKAADNLLSELKWDRSEINVLVFVSQTPDYKIPCTATILQDKLGIGKSCMAFDVNLGCSGYVYGLSIVSSLLAQIKGKGLLLVGDASSTCINLKDKTTAPLFSDAGSASALSFDDKAKPIQFNLQSDGAGYEAIISPDGGSRNPMSEDSLVFDEALGRTRADMFLDGIRVFNFSRREVAPNVTALLEHFERSTEDLSYFIFHQANKLMNDMIAKKLNLDMAKVPQSLRLLGNTGAASIPITLVDQLDTIIGKQDKEVLLSGFGVGLSWGSCIVSMEECTILKLIEY